MLEKTEIKTVTYKYKDWFMVDIVEAKGEYSAYLYNLKYGVKSLMFCILKESLKNNDKDDESTLFNRFIEMVETNLVNENYIENYTEEYMDA